MKKSFKIILPALFLVGTSFLFPVCNALKYDVKMHNYYKDDIKTPDLNNLADNDAILDDYNYPTHYPVQYELNYFLWYGVIPYIRLLGANFYFYDSNFGNAKSFISSVLGAVSSLGSDTNSTDDKKNMYPIKISKQPFQISQRFLKDKTSTSRNFGPNIPDGGDATSDNDPTKLDQNTDTSWVLSSKATINGGRKWAFNIPGFTENIIEGWDKQVDQDTTDKFMQVINYDEHLFTKDIFLVLCNQLQSKTSGSSSSGTDNIYSYWTNLSYDLIYSHNIVTIINPFLPDPLPPHVEQPEFTKFVDDFVNQSVKRVNINDGTNNVFNLSWGEYTDSAKDKTATFKLTQNSSKSYFLIDKQNAVTAKTTDLDIRSQINESATPNPVEFDRPDKMGKYNADMPDIVKYNVDPKFTPNANPTLKNTFNYFFQQAFLGVTIYGGILPKWYEGNALLSINTGNYLISDEIFSIYFKNNFTTSSKSLYEKWDPDLNTKNYYDFMNVKLNDYFSFSLNILINELWKTPSDVTIDLKDSNKIIKILKNNPNNKSLMTSLNDLSDHLKKYRDSSTDFNYLIAGHDVQIDIWNNYAVVVNNITDYLKIGSSTHNIWIIVGVILGLLVFLIIGIAIYREYVLANLRKKPLDLINDVDLEKEIIG